ncbi:MAG: PIN domain-containing protein [Candidatus Hermodarchaeota archaeon]
MVENYIVIDANFILLPFQFKIDYLTEITEFLEGITRFVIYQQILDELEAKKHRQPDATKFHMNLKSGLLYLEKNNEKYNIIYDQSIKLPKETTDSFLLNACHKLKVENNKVYLASNDAELRKKARENGINTIFLRQKKYLSYD